MGTISNTTFLKHFAAFYPVKVIFLKMNACVHVYMCISVYSPHCTATHAFPPVQFHQCITCLMSLHQSGITAVNVIKEMLTADKTTTWNFLCAPLCVFCVYV